MLLIRQGTIYTMTDTDPFIGDILIHDGKIIHIDTQITVDTPSCTEDDIQIIDANGLIVTPGLIEAHCHVGISGDKKTMDSDDANEITSPITPYLKGMDGINPLDPAFHSAIQAGITSLMVGPGSSNIVGGQFIFMKTDGLTRNIETMVVKEPAAMKCALGENPKKAFNELKVSPMTRMATAFLLREELTKAKEYIEKQATARRNHTDFSIDLRMECWIPVFQKEIPLKAHVHRIDDILTIIRIGKEFDLNVTLDHCSDGHLIVEDIRASGYPAIIGPSMVSRNKEEAVNIDFKTVGILNQSGVLVAITTDHPVIQIQYLPICAGLAVRHGLDMMEGLRAITRYPAMICGVSHRVGTIEIDKDADIAIYNGNPMETFTNCIYTIIDGRIVYDRYQRNS